MSFDFNWKDREQHDLRERYANLEDSTATEAWMDFLDQIQDLAPTIALSEPQILEAHKALQQFLLRATSAGQRNPRPTPRVFVSHQRNDILYAERMAQLALRHGFGYWLDIHDPRLSIAGQISFDPVIKSVLIAAIIEMAILNCTHCISIQTRSAQNSRWIPYEFGRLKDHSLLSRQVMSWFDNGVLETLTADYLRLGACCESENKLKAWLGCRTARSSRHLGCTAALGSLTFPPSILDNCEGFIATIKGDMTPWSIWIRTQFDAANFCEWSHWREGDPVTDALRSFAVEQLNAIVRGGRFATECALSSLEGALRAATKRLIGKSARSCAECAKLHRLLLEDAYPETLRRRRP